METELPENELESALVSADESVETRQEFLRTLVKSRVFVLLEQPWDGKSLPTINNRLLLVTDGQNKEQAMLAVFTTRKRAESFMPDENPFKHAVEVDAAWALLGVPDRSGMIVNPNMKLNFRVSPEVALMLRDVVQQDLTRRMGTGQGTTAK